MVKNLIKQYFIEQYNYDFVESDHGYIMYKKYEDNSVYIEQMYIDKSWRNKGIGQALFRVLVDKEKPASVYCDIDLSSKHGRESLEKFINHGFTECSKPSESRRILVKRYEKEN